MNKIDEVLELLKQRERESEKPKNVILWVLAIVGAVAAVAGIAYAVYRFVTPDYLEDFEDDFDDDFDDYFEDEAYGYLCGNYAKDEQFRYKGVSSRRNYQ